MAKMGLLLLIAGSLLVTFTQMASGAPLTDNKLSQHESAAAVRMTLMAAGQERLLPDANAEKIVQKALEDSSQTAVIAANSHTNNSTAPAVRRLVRQLIDSSGTVDTKAIDRLSDAELVAHLTSLNVNPAVINPERAFFDGGKAAENEAQAVQPPIVGSGQESSGGQQSSSFGSSSSSGSGQALSSSFSSFTQQQVQIDGGKAAAVLPPVVGSGQGSSGSGGGQQSSSSSSNDQAMSSSFSSFPQQVQISISPSNNAAPAATSTLYDTFQQQQQWSPASSGSASSPSSSDTPSPTALSSSSSGSSTSSSSFGFGEMSNAIGGTFNNNFNSLPSSLPASSSSSVSNILCSSCNPNVQGPEPGISAEQLFGGVDISSLLQPYGGGAAERDMKVDEQVQMLPPTEETRPETNEEHVHRYPDENKCNTVESNKEIHTYTVQKHRVNMKKFITERDMKVVNVNTNYITNVRHVNHPHKLIEIVKAEQIRHIPAILIKHTRTDKVNEVGQAQEVPTEEVKEQNVELPPIIERPTVQRVGYDGSSAPQQ